MLHSIILSELILKSVNFIRKALTNKLLDTFLVYNFQILLLKMITRTQKNYVNFFQTVLIWIENVKIVIFQIYSLFTGYTDDFET